MTHLCHWRNKMRQEYHQPVWKVSLRHVFRCYYLLASHFENNETVHGKLEHKKSRKATKTNMNTHTHTHTHTHTYTHTATWTQWRVSCIGLENYYQKYLQTALRLNYNRTNTVHFSNRDVSIHQYYNTLDEKDRVLIELSSSSLPYNTTEALRQKCPYSLWTLFTLWRLHLIHHLHIMHQKPPWVF